MTNRLLILLGSACLVSSASSATAADAAAIAEPEPMDYVRVCDTYGTGFYFLPGTETCLKIGGYVRYDIGIGDQTLYGYGIDVDGDGRGDTYYKRARAQINMDARSETEFGTLRGYGQLNFNYDTDGPDGVLANSSSDDLAIEFAYIELAGFRIGKNDSLFSTFTNYAGNIMSDDLAVPYGPFGTHQIVYTYTGTNGFSAAVGLEEGDDDYGYPYGLNNYTPHVVAGASFTQGWGGVGVVGGYDSVTEEGALKARLDVNANEQLSVFFMAGYSTNDAPGVLGNFDTNNYYAQWNGDYALWAGGSYAVSDRLEVAAQIAYDEDSNFAAQIDMPYTIVPDFTITPEINYVDNFDLVDADRWGGYLRFQRNF